MPPEVRHQRIPRTAHEQDDRMGRRASWLMWAFLAAAALLGGASRGDEVTLLLLRPVAVLAMLGWFLACAPADWRRVRVPLLLLGALAAVIVAQLLPLPPAIWSALPGHARFLEAAQVAGMAQPWRPISIAPQYTWNTLFALLVPAAALVGMAHVPARHDRHLVYAIVAIALFSAFFGLVQVSGADGLSLYRISSPELGVGLFANRNHQAVFLGASLPLLAAIARERRELPAHALAVGAGLALVATVFATGSRSGLIAGGVGLVLSAWIVLCDRPQGRSHPRGVRFWIMIGGILLALALLGTLAIMRGAAFERWSATEMGGEDRLQLLPVVLRLAKDYFPFGSGFGTFDPAFRIGEPDWALEPTFFNHAHNDPAELLMTGGLAAVLVLVAFVIWLTRAGAARRRQLREAASAKADGAIHLALSGFMALLLAASLTDYPLRTPLLMTLVAIATILLSARPRDTPAEP